MIAPLTRIVMRRDELREQLGRAPRAFRLPCGCTGGGQIRESICAELRAIELIKARIVTDGLLDQAERVSPR